MGQANYFQALRDVTTDINITEQRLLTIASKKSNFKYQLTFNCSLNKFTSLKVRITIYQSVKIIIKGNVRKISHRVYS